MKKSPVFTVKTGNHPQKTHREFKTNKITCIYNKWLMDT